MKTSLIFAGLGLLILSTSCGRQQGAHPANVPGEDSRVGVLMGQGLNHIDESVKGFCVELGKLERQSGNATGQFAEFRMLEITSESSLRESLNISASASFKGSLFGQASGRMSFASSVNKNSSSRYLMVHTRVANQLELASSYTFTESAQKILKNPALGEKKFTEQCGTQFVHGRRTGGEFYAIVEFEFNSSQEEKAFSAALQASGTGWQASTAINQALSAFNSTARTQVSLFRMGGTGTLPRIDDLKTFADKFPELVGSTAGSPVTLELITKDYKGVEPMDIGPNPGILAKQESAINTLARNRDNATEILRTIRHAQMNPEKYKLTGNENFSQAERLLNAYISAQNEAAVECFADVFTGCKVPATPTFPEVTLPERKWDPSMQCSGGFAWDRAEQKCCKAVLTRVCTIPGPGGTCMAYDTRSEKQCQ